MEATEKKATPINDFYDYLFSIEREMEAVEDAQKRLAIANQELKNTKDKAVVLYHAAWEAAREAGQEIPDSIICGTTLVRIDDEGGYLLIALRPSTVTGCSAFPGQRVKCKNKASQ
ncbi:TPA: hypothetical protein QCK66_000507 [Pseudomonas aeruginosa]|nr:hypothetical protein [Pseudomonas aeruginosa]